MPFLTQGKTNWKYIIIVLILAVIVGGGILWWVEKQEVPPGEFPEIEKPEKIVKLDLSTPEKTFTLYTEAIKTEDFNLMRKLYSKEQQDLVERNINLMQEAVNKGDVLWKAIFFLDKEQKDFVVKINSDNSGYVPQIGERKTYNKLYQIEFNVGFGTYAAHFVEEDDEWRIPGDWDKYDYESLDTLCSSTQIEGYRAEEIEEDLDRDNQQEVIRIYTEDKEDLGTKPIIVKVFSGNENCPKELFHYQGTGNIVWGTQVFSDFWGDGAKAVLIRDVSYAGGSGSTVNITFLTYRQGQYQIIKGPKFSGHDWRCCKFDGDNGLGKKIIGAEHWWGLNYEYYCAGCTSPLQFIIYTWNGEGYTKTVAGITKNSYGPESIDEIIEKEPSVLNQQ